MYGEDAESGVAWFIVGALIVAFGVMVYLYTSDHERAPPAFDGTTPKQVNCR